MKTAPDTAEKKRRSDLATHDSTDTAPSPLTPSTGSWRRRLVVILIMFILLLSGFISGVIPSSTYELSYSIVTDRDTYRYGDTVAIDLALYNHGRFRKTVHFNGYGGDQHELEIAPVGGRGKVYTPTTNALSGNVRSSLTLGAGEQVVFHYEWNLFEFSAGGCTGPYYGDLVAPGEYEIVTWLNLAFDGDRRGLEQRKTITVEELDFTAPATNLTLIESVPPGSRALLNASRHDEGVLLNYSPIYHFSPEDVQNLTVDSRLYENGFLYLSLGYFAIGSESADRKTMSKEDPYYRIDLTVTLVETPERMVIGFYDHQSFGGWGSAPSTVVVGG